MKKSSKKLLFYLGQSNETHISLGLRSLEYILPELSQAGVRSLLYWVKKNFYLEIFHYQKEQQLQITTSGMRHLKVLFPAVFAFDELEEDEWSCMVFIQPPKNDLAFRHLRYLVLADGAQAMTRGVYLRLGKFSLGLLETCEEFYQQSISVFTLKQWVFGFDSLNLLKKLGIEDHINLLSGISKETDNLLDNFIQNKNWHHQQKLQIVNLLDRFYELALASSLLGQKYFTQDISIRLLHQKCQRLLKLL